MTTTEISSRSLSTAIILNLFRQNLQAAVTAGDITDPAATRRGTSGAPMVQGEFPDRNPMYPHIIVQEASDAADRPDSRVDLWEHRYAVNIEIRAKSATTMYKVRDQVRGWVEEHVDTLNAAGFTDPQISPGISLNWDDQEQVRRWAFTVTGTVYTKYEPPEEPPEGEE